MQHDNGRRVGRLRPDHAIFEIAIADMEKAGRREGSHACRDFRRTTTCALSPLARSFPPPLWGRVGAGGELQSPAFAVPPSPPLPHKGGESRAHRAATFRFSIVRDI